MYAEANSSAAFNAVLRTLVWLVLGVIGRF